MIRGILLLALAAGSSAFLPAPSRGLFRHATQKAAAAIIVEDPLPNVYVYDHCPFCVRVRLALGVKGIKHNLVFLGNDDIATPTALVGKKISPILEMPSDKMVMGESLDIIDYFEKNEERFGPALIKPASGRTDLKAWQKKMQTTFRCLTRPRYMQTLLPEFMQQDGKDAFVNNHQIPPYEKAEWKGADSGLSMEKKWELYNAELGKTAEYLPSLNEGLAELETLIHCDTCCTEGGFSYDDVDLWSRLRSLSLIKGAEFGPTTFAYMKHFEAEGDVPLYFGMQV